jgi:hypothetical protein
MKQNDQSNEKYTVNKIHGAPNTTFKDGKISERLYSRKKP